MKKIKKYILCLPKSLIFNIKYFGIKKGIRLPILISNNIRIKKISGNIEIQDKFSFGVIKIGFGELGIFDRKNDKGSWQVYGNVLFRGKCDLGQGVNISVGKNGLLEIGNGVTISGETSIICKERIVIGDECLISWENLIMDTDFHKINYDNRSNSNITKEIILERNVWVCARCTILKGSKISAGSVVGSNSFISKGYEDKNVLIVGNPAVVKKKI